MKKRKTGILKWCMALVLLCSVFCTSLGSPVTAEAAAKGLASYKTVSSEKGCKIGKTYFYMKYNSSTGKYIVYAKKNGKKRVITKNCGSRNAVTNGKYLYYGTGTVIPRNPYGSTFRNRKLVRCTVSSRKNKTLKKLSGEGAAWTPIACDGRYLYYGTAAVYSASAVSNFSVLDQKNGKTKTSNYDASEVRKAGSRVLVSGNAFPPGRGSIVYLMSRDGKPYQYISFSGINVRIKGKYIYLSAIGNWGNGLESRNFKCTLDGKLA